MLSYQAKQKTGVFLADTKYNMYFQSLINLLRPYFGAVVGVFLQRLNIFRAFDDYP
jgi:hypothetical protein